MILDNEPEFAGTTVDVWAVRNGVHRHFITPGKPVQNPCSERVHGKFLDKYLNEHWLLTLQDAQLVIEAWRREDNEE